MSAVATCPLDVHMAELLRIEYKPLPADAKPIAGKLIAAGGGAALDNDTPVHINNLATDLNAEAQGGAGPPAAGTPGAGQAAAAAAASAAAATATAGVARAPHGS